MAKVNEFMSRTDTSGVPGSLVGIAACKTVGQKCHGGRGRQPLRLRVFFPNSTLLSCVLARS